MSDYEFDILIYIGRFQPLHLGHQSVIEDALSRAKHVVLLVGSSNRPRSLSNPWTFAERTRMIESAFASEVSRHRLTIQPLPDILYNDDAWLAQVQQIMTSLISIQSDCDGFDPKTVKVGLIGFDKDASTYYLKKFPQWETVKITESWGTVSATDIRANFFQKAPALPQFLVSDPVLDFMRGFMLTPAFRYVLGEFEHIRHHRKLWEGAPFPPWAVTADAVVTQSGHILLVTRGEYPGKGLLALPGGHVDVQAGDSLDNAVKELWEEAQPMDRQSQNRSDPKPMPKGRLRGFYTGDEMRFDAPGRDPRGNYLTTAFRFVFPDGDLFRVSGGDDAAHAAWYPLGSLDPEKMFLDHYFIIQSMLGGTA